MTAAGGWFWLEFEGSAGDLDLLLAGLADASLGGAVDEEGESGRRRLRLYWPLEADREDVELRGARICARLDARRTAAGLQEPEDWLAKWREHRRPVQASARILVCPPERVRRPGPGGHVVVIDQRMAFGSGHHATTRLCLQLLEDHLRPGQRVIDVGAGSAVLAIAAALLGAGGVTAVESDPEVIPEARANLRRNGVEPLVRLVNEPFGRASLEPADLVVSNLILSELLPLLERMAAAAPGGVLLVSGVEEEQREEMLAAVRSSGLHLLEERSVEGWRAFACRCPR